MEENSDLRWSYREEVNLYGHHGDCWNYKSNFSFGYFDNIDIHMSFAR